MSSGEQSLRLAFDPAELEEVGAIDSCVPVRGVPQLKSPISNKENMLMALRGEKPYWYPSVGLIGGDYKPLRSRSFPDILASHDVIDDEGNLDWNDYGVTLEGWFGCQFSFIDFAEMAVVLPGPHTIQEIKDWTSLPWPNLDEIDWEKSAQLNAKFLDSQVAIEFCIPCGYWERLVNCMSYYNAVKVFEDEAVAADLGAFYAKLTDLYIEMARRAQKYYGAEIILLQDNWGSKESPAFSYEQGAALIQPHLTRFIQAVHDMGMYVEFSSLGKIEELAAIIVDAGADLWCPDVCNDAPSIVERFRDESTVFGIDVGISLMTSKDEQTRVAENFAKTYGDGPVAFVDFSRSPHLYKEMYMMSRQLYQG